MIDTTKIDILAVIAPPKSKRVSENHGGEYHCPCPFCDGNDRFIIQLNRNGDGGRWLCRQCNNHWSDVIAYVQKRDGSDFKDACRTLGLDDQLHHGATAFTNKEVEVRQNNRTSQTITYSKPTPKHALTSPQWQQQAYSFVMQSITNLWSADGLEARQWLHDRGLSDQIIQGSWIGYNPVDGYESRTDWGFSQSGTGNNIWLPRGITIPWYTGSKCWRINIRRLENTDGPKYISPAGYANGLYNINNLQPGCIIVMVEGEFDALSILCHASDIVHQYNIVPIAIGSCSSARYEVMVDALSHAKLVLLAFDTDKPGQEAAQWWQKALHTNAIILPPLAHDVNDMVRNGYSVRDWLLNALATIYSAIAA